jgi:regulator of cell morphogenesis and NO signaling
MQFTPKQKIADIVLHDYLLIPVIERFGIRMGFGDKSVEQLCAEYAVDVDFFLAIVNAFHDSESFPENSSQSISIEMTVDYLHKSHLYYNQYKIPKIEHLISQLEWEVDHEKNLKLISNFFEKYRNEINNHTLKEETEVYPFAVEIEKEYHKSGISPRLIELIEHYSVSEYARNHDDIDEKLLDLKNIIIKYLPPAKNQEIVNDLLVELFILEKELSDHTRIENKILIPKLKTLEKNLRKIIKTKPI